MTNPIDLGKPGRYKMTVWTFFHCPNALCDSANDRIQIKMKEDGATDYDKIIFQLSTGDGRKDRKWTLSEIFFEAATTKIFVCFFCFFKVYSYQSTSCHFSYGLNFQEKVPLQMLHLF